MCIHIEDELVREINFWRKEGLSNVSGVMMFDKDYDFVGSWLCYADQPQSIAQAVHVLKTWHPEATNVSLTLVNGWRAFRKLPVLSEETLPAALPVIADGVTDEDTPERTRLIVKQWLRDALAASYERA